MKRYGLQINGVLMFKILENAKTGMFRWETANKIACTKRDGSATERTFSCNAPATETETLIAALNFATNKLGLIPTKENFAKVDLAPVTHHFQKKEVNPATVKLAEEVYAQPKNLTDNNRYGLKLGEDVVIFKIIHNPKTDAWRWETMLALPCKNRAGENITKVFTCDNAASESDTIKTALIFAERHGLSLAKISKVDIAPRKPFGHKKTEVNPVIVSLVAEFLTSPADQKLG